MSESNHDWIVFHRVRFASSIDGRGKPFPGPKGALAWRFYPACPLGEDGMPTFVSDEWGGIGIYTSREAAEAVFSNPEDHLGFLGETTEAFHALVVPYAQGGSADWRGSVLENATFVLAPDPGGPLMVMTSAGYVNPGPDDLPRIGKFVYEVRQIQSFFSSLPDNVRNAVFSASRVDGHDGMTVTIWKTDTAMMAAAYKRGHHRSQMDHHREARLFDRNSWARARILATKGSWNGTDPVEDIARPAVPHPAMAASSVQESPVSGSAAE
jgi:hypothetical protein